MHRSNSAIRRNRRPASSPPPDRLIRGCHRPHRREQVGTQPDGEGSIEAGVSFDLVITNPNLIEDLATSSKVLAGSQVPFGRISMGVAAKAGSRTLSINSLEEFEHALKSAKSIAYACEGTSGGYFSSLLERMGLTAEVKPKLVPISGGQTATSVARGEAELAVVPITSILAAAPEIILVGPFPSQLQSHIDFDLAISAVSTNARAARRLSDFFTHLPDDAAERARQCQVEAAAVR